ncbi:MAG: contractile injection system tape measure protein [Bacteroidota bacterium]
MIGSDKHIIKHQILDLDFSGTEEVEIVCDKVSAIYKQKIGRILDEICAELFSEDPLIKIDSLSIDIGSLDTEDLEGFLPKAMKASLKEAIYKNAQDQKVSFATSKEKVNVNEDNALIFYLKTGRMAWNFDGGLAELRSAYAHKEIPMSLSLDQLLRYVDSRRRFLSFFEEKNLFSTLRRHIPGHRKRSLDKFETLKYIWSQLPKSLNRPLANGWQSVSRVFQSPEIRYLQVVEHIILGPTSRDGLSFLDILPAKYGLILRNTLQEEATRVPNHHAPEVIDCINEVIAKISGSATRERQASRDDEEKHPSLVLQDISTRPGDSISDVGKENHSSVFPGSSFENGEREVINNAGLILLWPYLQAFFTGLGLVQKKEFVHKAASTKAVHLLHYLVFGNSDGDETEWLLNKLLCGLAPTSFVPETFELLPNEIEECNHLLEAVIKNWPALKNTGIDSLRSTFLQRDGLLAKEANGWLLKVEERAFDILLDKLTWAISVVRLPWTEYMIHTKW